MDMNFPHDSVNQERNDMIDLDAVRSSIVANASARQAGSETAKQLQRSINTSSQLRKMQSQTAMKARILFFAKSENGAHMNHKLDIAKGSFSPKYSQAKSISHHSHSKCENGVNLNGSNNVKSNIVEQMHGNDEIVEKTTNSLVNRG